MAEKMISLKLAHPLDADQVARLRAKETGEIGVGGTITVPEAEARGIIQAGYAQVDSEDADAVAKALAGDTKVKTTKGEDKS